MTGAAFFNVVVFLTDTLSSVVVLVVDFGFGLVVEVDGVVVVGITDFFFVAADGILKTPFLFEVVVVVVVVIDDDIVIAPVPRQSYL